MINGNILPEIANTYLVPIDTRAAIKNANIDNFYLKFHKYILTDQDGIINKKNLRISFPFNQSFLRNKLDELTNAAKCMFGKSFKEFDKQLSDKLIVGLGNESVYETSITLHFIYGIPYIPGSSLKGAVRNYVIKEYFNSNEYKALTESQAFCYIFGCPEKTEKNKETILKHQYQGDIIFFDALPIYLDNNTIVEDIMNPHYGEYYQDLKPPADYLMPVPINFWVVKNTSFKFILGATKNRKVNWQGKEYQNLDLIEMLTKEALEKFGIGAKTSVGYGFFK